PRRHARDDPPPLPAQRLSYGNAGVPYREPLRVSASARRNRVHPEDVTARPDGLHAPPHPPHGFRPLAAAALPSLHALFISAWTSTAPSTNLPLALSQPPSGIKGIGGFSV